MAKKQYISGHSFRSTVRYQRTGLKIILLYFWRPISQSWLLNELTLW